VLSIAELENMETQISDLQSQKVEIIDPIEKLMSSRSSEGYRLLEKCINILFEECDEAYVMYVI